MKIVTGYTVFLDMKKNILLFYKIIKKIIKTGLDSYQGLDRVFNIRLFLFCNVVLKILDLYFSIFLELIWAHTVC